jgi:hypothetical protein
VSLTLRKLTSEVKLAQVEAKQKNDLAEVIFFAAAR